MYFGDHPPPHVHVAYQGFEALIAIEDGAMLEGRLPPRALRLAREWIELRRDAILNNWSRAERLEPLDRIEGLE
jgi:hypothetical protein